VANTQAVFGFKHIGYLSGGAPDYQMSTRLILSTNTTKIYFGDPVQKANGTSNYIVQGVGGTAAAGTAIIQGIFAGCEYTPSGGLGIPQWSPYWPGAATADAKAYIIDAPNALFLVASLATAIVTGQIGLNFGFNIGTGSTSGGCFSGASLDQSTATSVTTTLPFKLQGMYAGVGNGADNSSNYNWTVVTFNNQIFRTLAGGV
jgi:hypothetical protein